jgi:gliding motility-associated-like protein
LSGRSFYIAILCLLLFYKASATHIVGGEIYYTCVGGNNYKITLKLYRDCFNGQAPFDSPAYIGIYDASGVLLNTLSLNYTGPNLIPPVVISPCLVPPANVCVEEAIYEQTVNLPPLAGGYNIVYQRCCRNGTITNILDPGDTGSSYLAHIPDPSLASCNSSPRFTNFPPLFLCSNVNFNFDHVATDPDGDVLVYSFCDPYAGASTINPAPNPPDPPPFPYINYLGGYNATYPIDANPAFNINSSTGYLTGTPTNIGQYVVGVCVSEYRNGVLLSTNKRDFQFNILFCDAAIASIPAQTLFCNGYTVNFSGAASVNSNSYFWNFGDPSTQADTSNLVSTSYTYPDSGVYTVMLVAYDPSGNCYDTAYSDFEIYPLLDALIVSPPAQCFDNNSFDFAASGSFTADATFLWDFGPTATPQTSTQQNPTGINFSNLGSSSVSLSISQYGCTETYVGNGNVNTVQRPTAEISSANQYCVGYQIFFQNNSANSTAWHWDFGINGTLADTSNLFQPTFIYPDSGIYTISLIAYNQGICTDTTDINFWVYPLLNPLMTGAGDQCLTNNNFDFSAAGAFTTDATFEWDFGPNASVQQTSIQNPQDIVYSQLGTFPVVLTMSQYGCIKSITDSVGLFPSPTAKFSIDGGYGCSPVYVQLIDSSYAATPYLYQWNFGDNSSINTANPSHSYENTGSYTITLTIVTTYGCVDTSTYVLPNAVNVFPYPIAGFTAEPMSASIFDPIITFTDTSSLATHCAIRISDGTYVENCNYTHTFSDTGYFKVTQIVKNELNCIDSVSITVYIYPEYRLFIPDAFTPNSDGLNDIFKPSTIGIKEYSFQIFNRWGEKIYISNGPEDGWDGNYKGSKSPQGAYVYLLNVVDVKGRSHEYNGKVVLIR